MADTKNQLLAYCGLYCGDCIMRKGEVADLARDLRKKLRQVKFGRMVPGLSVFLRPLANYDTCYETLGAMVRLRCRRACSRGGGNPGCRPRQCVQRKGLRGCWQCPDFETCKKLDFIKAVHQHGLLGNLRRLRRGGTEAFIRGKRDW